MVLPASMDATWLDGGTSFTSQELRRADASLFTGEGTTPLGVYGGIVRHSDSSLAVTINASDVVTVQPGAVVIRGNSGVGNGVYRTALAAAETGTLVARNATNPRIDLVVYRALDTSVVPGHGAYTGRIEIIAGTPAASPVAPTLPAMAEELARINVPNSAGGTAVVDSTFRTFAAAIGGMLPVATAARLPTAPNAKWLHAVAVDTGIEYVWNGTSWNASLSVDPTLGASMALNGNGVSSRRDGQVVTVTWEIAPTAAKAAGTTLLTVPWPPTSKPIQLLHMYVPTSGVLYGTLTTGGLLTCAANLGAGEVIRGSVTYVV